jgi:hypothetical protein
MAFATAAIYQNSVLTHTVNLNVNHSKCSSPAPPDCNPDHIDLSFSDITEIAITPTASETGGTQYDNFMITTQAVTTVPEPSTLLLTGFCGIVWAGRRLLAHGRS